MPAKLAAEGACRLCERSSELRPLTRHRLFPGRKGGRYVYKNVVPLCRPCHDAVERDVNARRMLRPKLWPSEIGYVIANMGHEWLDEVYPRPAQSGAGQLARSLPY